MSRKSTKGTIAVLAIAAAAASWVIFSSETSEDPSQTATPTATSEAPSEDEGDTPDADAGPPAYDRDEFGSGWVDVDENGCDTRNDMLRRDLSDTEYKPGTRGCLVTSGTLKDPYSGKTVEFTRGEGTSELVQIDHVVPLKWAWDNGAHEWRQSRRVQFANDPWNLTTTTREANAAKSDSPPSEWVPYDQAGVCRYVRVWVDLTAKYELDLPDAEAAALDGHIEKCPSLATP